VSLVSIGTTKLEQYSAVAPPFDARAYATTASFHRRYCQF
jgi:hypothetical protein